jgi:hypothetical protein
LISRSIRRKSKVETYIPFIYDYGQATWITQSSMKCKADDWWVGKDSKQDFSDLFQNTLVEQHGEREWKLSEQAVTWSS